MKEGCGDSLTGNRSVRHMEYRKQRAFDQDINVTCEISCRNILIGVIRERKHPGISYLRLVYPRG
jgi:hypothetical protein